MKLGIVTNLYRKGHPTINPDGNPNTPCAHVTMLEAGFMGLTGEERARCTGIPATFDAEPPLLAVCEFDESHHELHCRGVARGKVEPILREHFTMRDNNVEDGSSDTGPWVTTFIIGTLSDGQWTDITPVVDGQGVMDIRSRRITNSTTRLGKKALAISQVSGGALWFRSRIRFPAPTLMQCLTGFANDSAVAPTNGAGFQFHTGVSPNWYGYALSAGIASYVEMPHVVTANVWYDLDMILDGDQGFTALWVNGDGPYTLSSTSPVSALTPWLMVGSLSNLVHTAYCDLIFVDMIRGVDVRHPLQDPALALIGV